MICKNQISISLLVLSLALVNVKSEYSNEKTCVTQGFNGYLTTYPYPFPLLNAEDRKPITLNARHTDDFKSICPNQANNDELSVTCCDPEQLWHIIGTANMYLKLDDDSCQAALTNIYCQLYCKPDQNKYVKVLKKSKSFLKYYDNKMDADTISAKVGLKFVDDFFNNCRNVSMPGQEGGETLEEVVGEHVSYRLLWSIFNNSFFVNVDFRFYNETSNETFHLFRNVLGVVHKEPIEDDSIQMLPLVFEKVN